MCYFILCIFKLISFLKVNQHAQHSNGSSRFLLIYNVYLQIHSVFESKSTCTTFKWLFKVHALLQCVSSNTLLFLKVNQHAQQSNGYSRFMLFYYVYLQTYLLFESKSTFTAFKWLFKVRALFQCVSSNLFRFWK